MNTTESIETDTCTKENLICNVSTNQQGKIRCFVDGLIKTSSLYGENKIPAYYLCRRGLHVDLKIQM